MKSRLTLYERMEMDAESPDEKEYRAEYNKAYEAWRESGFTDTFWERAFRKNLDRYINHKGGCCDSM